MSEKPTEAESADMIAVTIPTKATPIVASGLNNALSSAPAAADAASSKRKGPVSSTADQERRFKRLRLVYSKKAQQSPQTTAEGATTQISTPSSQNTTNPPRPTPNTTDQAKATEPAVIANAIDLTTTITPPLNSPLTPTQAARPTTTAASERQPGLSASGALDGAVGLLPAPTTTTIQDAAPSTQPGRAATDVAPKSEPFLSTTVTCERGEGTTMPCLCPDCFTFASLSEFDTLAEDWAAGRRSGSAQPTAEVPLLGLTDAEFTIFKGMQKARRDTRILSQENGDLRREVEMLRPVAKSVDTLRASNNRMSSQLPKIPELESKVQELQKRVEELTSEKEELKKTCMEGQVENMALSMEIADLRRTLKYRTPVQKDNSAGQGL